MNFEQALAKEVTAYRQKIEAMQESSAEGYNPYPNRPQGTAQDRKNNAIAACISGVAKASKCKTFAELEALTERLWQKSANRVLAGCDAKMVYYSVHHIRSCVRLELQKQAENAW